MNIIDYLKNQSNRSFKEAAINQLDIAVLNEINYLVFKDFLDFKASAKDGITFKELAQNYKSLKQVRQENPEKSNELFLAYQSRVQLLELLAESSRFENCLLFGYQDIFDDQEEIQFAASSFAIDQNILIVYRGTDSSFTGWKEDFNLAYLSQIPSQKLALDYLETISHANQGNIILSGHSKGGNLALYAAYQSKHQERIQDIYLFDAPGLAQEDVETPSYQSLLPKIHAFRPQSSLVGILFDKQVEETIIKSSGINLMQHLLLLWQVDLAHSQFIQADKTSQVSDKAAQISQNFLSNNSKANNKRLINLIYRILREPRQEMTLLEKLKSILSLLKSSSKAEKNALLASLKNIILSVKDSDIRPQRQESEYLRSRRLFLSALMLPEKLARQSKYLALLVLLTLILTLYVIYQDAQLNLIIFSCLFFLCSLIAGVLSLSSWIKAEQKLTLEYLPGLSCFCVIINLIYQATRSHFHFSLITNSLPNAMLFLLALALWQTSYQYLKTKDYLPEIAHWLKRAAILSAILIVTSLVFPSFLLFFMDWILILIIIGKIISVSLISYFQWSK
ncbi:Mbeg1-like protein [Streptococcus loxodontisalivarius]|uniref:Esterase n=1 Tax=Streptococcus loxodontisalivarius TaxID=1349415 RepID=A0ABS2PS60_9STRE|nr:Mbeg1-like protein [Streptococcus loxodontisalivarius]MBM7642390.1 putative esterase [Streptococcus loxodontisalivarius]